VHYYKTMFQLQALQVKDKDKGKGVPVLKMSTTP
jgi:hypothetical protein